MLRKYNCQEKSFKLNIIGNKSLYSSAGGCLFLQQKIFLVLKNMINAQKQTIFITRNTQCFSMKHNIPHVKSD